MQNGHNRQATASKNQPLLVIEELMTIRLTGEDTDNKYAVVESITRPGSGVPLLHTHPAQETFYVLEGDYEIYRRDAAGNKIASPAPAGSVIHVPANEPHGFANVGSTDGKMLMIFEPAGVMERFFTDLGIPVEANTALDTPASPPDMEKLLAACARHNIQFQEAPPGQSS